MSEDGKEECHSIIKRNKIIFVHVLTSAFVFPRLDLVGTQSQSVKFKIWSKQYEEIL
jgi:hypothetical protein